MSTSPRHAALAVLFLAMLAVPARTGDAQEGPYQSCINEDPNAFDIEDRCLDIVGRDRWMPPYRGGLTPEVSCALTRDILASASAMGMRLSYKLLFQNERCRRLGYFYFERP
jgi:hypothetical protein